MEKLLRALKIVLTLVVTIVAGPVLLIIVITNESYDGYELYLPKEMTAVYAKDMGIELPEGAEINKLTRMGGIFDPDTSRVTMTVESNLNEADWEKAYNRDIPGTLEGESSNSGYHWIVFLDMDEDGNLVIEGGYRDVECVTFDFSFEEGRKIETKKIVHNIMDIGAMILLYVLIWLPYKKIFKALKRIYTGEEKEPLSLP